MWLLPKDARYWTLAAAAAIIIAGTYLPAGASTHQGCKSTSLLNELDVRDRFGLENLLRNARAIENSESVLWKIEKAGRPPSHLFGTVHIVDESLSQLRPAVAEAIGQSTTVALEAAEMSRATAKYAMAKAGPLMVSTERPLLKILDEEEMGVVERALFKAGFPKEMALGFRPWVVTMFLSDSECQKSKHERGLKSLDLMVSEEAEARNIKVVGLEKMLEQYEAMAALPDSAQAAWLKASVHLHDRVDDMAYTMAELYRFRRLGAVWELTRELAPAAGLDDAALSAIEHVLVVRRNERMFERAVPLIDDGGAFIAIGALHLMGKNGFVAMLRARGYDVTAVE